MTNKTVVLAFSGGLDTSFCVPYLMEQGFDVVTLFCDTGGVSADELAYIEQRAMELGAKRHVNADASQQIWDEVVVPLIWGGAFYQDQYPLLCSDRYLIVRKSLELCDELGTRYFAHGCTGMGNDQVRFDLTVRALGDYEILAPVREVQRDVGNVREYEQQYLAERGFGVRAKTSQYTINENILGVTVSGSEVDNWQAPGEGTYQLTAKPADWPREPARATIRFEEGLATHLDGERIGGPAMLKELNRRFGAYGVGRGMYTGDTTIGLKGRIVFEAPALVSLRTAHRALEEAVATNRQNRFKENIAKKWVELTYEGFFYDPLKADLEAYLQSSQRRVNGEVTLETSGGNVHAVKIDSPHILRAKRATYAQSADWGVAEAEGFIKLFGQSSTLHAEVNRAVDGE